MSKKLEGDTAIIRQGGVFKPADLYEWQGNLFAKAGGGYVRVLANGTTSKDGLEMVHVATDVQLYVGKFDRIAVEAGPGRKKIGLSSDGVLLLSGANAS